MTVSDAWIDAWLGAPRFARYVTTCGGDRARALRLYEWNVALGQALMHDIAHFEVALRNAYDTVIQRRWRGGQHWLLDPESPAVTPIWRVRTVKGGLKRGIDVNYPNRRSVEKAIDRCGGVRASPGKVIAELSFGFWANLTSASHEKTLWVPYLHHAYPVRTNRRGPDQAIRCINTVRNRISHHEPVIDPIDQSMDPGKIAQDIRRLLGQLAPSVESHVVATSTVTAVLNQRPS
ncbi:MAG: Abi family protein [Micropruina sp.]|uniref:Abi family protein n=1 Tax=Micropruina sp. TaxID=2737536 RepID=UPI0039E229C8